MGTCSEWTNHIQPQIFGMNCFWEVQKKTFRVSMWNYWKQQKSESQEQKPQGEVERGSIRINKKCVRIRQTAYLCSVYRVRQVFDLVWTKYDVLHKLIHRFLPKCKIAELHNFIKTSPADYLNNSKNIIEFWLSESHFISWVYEPEKTACTNACKFCSLSFKD